MVTNAAPTHEPMKEPMKELDTGVIEAVVAVYDTHEAAEKAVRAVQKAGFDMRKLSIISKDYQTEEEVVGYYSTLHPHVNHCVMAVPAQFLNKPNQVAITG